MRLEAIEAVCSCICIVQIKYSSIVNKRWSHSSSFMSIFIVGGAKLNICIGNKY